MRHRKTENMTRRNVTLSRYRAEDLEKAAGFLGRTQGEVLEAALGQPIMRRLYALAKPDGGNFLACLLEVYQADESYMHLRIGEAILHAVKDWLEAHGTMKQKEAMKQAAEHVNSYVCGHMTEGSMDADPYFRTVHDQAEEGCFIIADIKEDVLKMTTVKYINSILAGPNDRNRMGESYLFRNLKVILDECFEAPTEEETKQIAAQLSDGRVLPAFQ